MIVQLCEACIDTDIDLQNFCSYNGPSFHQHDIHMQDPPFRSINIMGSLKVISLILLSIFWQVSINMFKSCIDFNLHKQINDFLWYILAGI